MEPRFRCVRATRRGTGIPRLVALCPLVAGADIHVFLSDSMTLDALRAAFDEETVVGLVTVASAGVAATTVADALNVHPADDGGPGGSPR